MVRQHRIVAATTIPRGAPRPCKGNPLWPGEVVCQGIELTNTHGARTEQDREMTIRCRGAHHPLPPSGPFGALPGHSRTPSGIQRPPPPRVAFRSRRGACTVHRTGHGSGVYVYYIMYTISPYGLVVNITYLVRTNRKRSIPAWHWTAGRQPTWRR